MHTEEDSLTLLHTITGSWNAGCNCPPSAGDSQQCLQLLFHGRVRGSSFPCALLTGPTLAGPCPPAGECPELMMESVQSRISKSSFTACFRKCTLSSGVMSSPMPRQYGTNSLRLRVEVGSKIALDQLSFILFLTLS